MMRLAGTIARPLARLWHGALRRARSGYALIVGYGLLFRGVVLVRFGAAAAVSTKSAHVISALNSGVGAWSVRDQSGGIARAPRAHSACCASRRLSDCSCYFTENFFVRSPIEGHFTYCDAASFSEEHASLVGTLTEPKREELLANLETEAARRRAVVTDAVERKARVAAEYTPLHPDLWKLIPDRWLHPEFVKLVDGARHGATGWRPPPQLARGVYSLPVFSPAFCSLLCEELAAFSASGLPRGRPNSMNRYGTLLDELGMSPGLLDPLMRDWLRPLAAALPPLAAVGGATLDHHKSFVVAYRLGEDEHLTEHFDNAEITLNVNLGADFEGGELVFYGHRLSADGTPKAHHDWAEQGSGRALLHLGQEVHAALPISSGERFNLVICERRTEIQLRARREQPTPAPPHAATPLTACPPLVDAGLRSSSHRRVAGCPMCGETSRLLSPPTSQL